MRVGELVGIAGADAAERIRFGDAEREDAGWQRCPDRVDVLRLGLTGGEARGETPSNRWTADIDVEPAFLVGRFVAGKRVPRVEGVVLDHELGVAVPGADPAALDDVGAASGPEPVVLCRERVVVDADVLRLGRPRRGCRRSFGGGRGGPM